MCCNVLLARVRSGTVCHVSGSAHLEDVSGEASLACRLRRAFVSQQQVSTALRDGLLWLLLLTFSHAIVILSKICISPKVLL